jgi:hypothetical protein
MTPFDVISAALVESRITVAFNQSRSAEVDDMLWHTQHALVSSNIDFWDWNI